MLSVNDFILGDPEITANLHCNFAYLYWEGCVKQEQTVRGSEVIEPKSEYTNLEPVRGVVQSYVSRHRYA